MTPVINPIWFYLMSICDGIVGVSVGIFAFCLIILIIFVSVLYLDDILEDEEVPSKLKKFIKKDLIILIVSGLIFLFVPDKQTLFEMTIADTVTYENLDKTKNTVKELVDYITEKVEGKDKTK